MTKKRKSSNDQAKAFLGLKEIKGDFSKLKWPPKEINIKGDGLKEIKGGDYSKWQPIKPRYAFVVEDKDDKSK